VTSTLTREPEPRDPMTPDGASEVAAVRLRALGRSVAATWGTAALAAVLFVATLMIGKADVSVGEVVTSLLGLSDDGGIDFIVRDLRLPTAATALAVGAALGLSGIIFQKLLANPLASPDFVGVSSGASLFGVAGVVIFGLSGIGTSAMALLGATVSAVLIYLLAWRDGISGYRFILIGIGVQSFMIALTGYVISRADLFEVPEAMTWVVGSVCHAGSTELRIVCLVLLLALPAALVLTRTLHVLELGDDTATALGTRVEVSRIALIGVSIVLVGFATAAAGPLLFVALMAGPIAMRLVGGSGGGLLAAAFVGASIVLAANLFSQHVLPEPVPTGVVTGAVGAPYLIWLMVTANREGRGG
jgi:iron complex transport system permease protein